MSAAREDSTTNGRSAIGRRRFSVAGTLDSCIDFTAATQSSAADAAWVCPRIERVAVVAGHDRADPNPQASADATARSNAGTAAAGEYTAPMSSDDKPLR